MQQKPLSLILLICFCASMGFSQSDPYRIHLPSASLQVNENLDTAIQQLESGGWDEFCSDGYWFGIMQFHDLPDAETKNALEKSGVRFSYYVSGNAYYVSLPSAIAGRKLKNHSIRALLPLKASQKLSNTLYKGAYPEHALDGTGKVTLSVVLYPEIKAELLLRNHANWTLIHLNPALNSIELQIPLADLPLLSQLPGILHIDAGEKPIELEQQVNRTNHRSNVIAVPPDFFGGLAYDGTGVTAAVSEGMADTTQIDFHGRLNPSYHTGNSFSGHATGVMRRMGGAGNYNPLDLGMAYGADMLTVNGGIWNNNTLYTSEGMRVANHSYGYGCQGGYNSASTTIDLQVRTRTGMMHVFSCGNIGRDSTCAWYGVPGWANITGAVKSAKNVIATGALNKHDERMGFSSKGPAYDGRIKPDMCAVGPGGTSHAAPGVAGVYTQLFHAFKSLSSGNEPESGMLKAILQNTAEDLGNPGPDFQFGYGRINARRAYETILDQRWAMDSVTNSSSKTQILNVPAGTAEVRILVYWSDVEAAPGATKALVNDLDLTVTNNGVTWTPWILDHSPTAAALDAPATRGLDTLNNMEQVTLANPTAGNYTITVTGSEVPSGPQKYYVVWEFLTDEVVLTYPNGAETFVPGETETLHWDSYGGTGDFSVEYSPDNGVTWSTLAANIPATQKYYDWTIPNSVTGEGLIKVTRGTISAQPQRVFSIVGIPQNIDVLWSCGTSAMLIWDAVPGATTYEVFKLGPKYMDSIGLTTQGYFAVSNLSLTDSTWFSVRAIGPNGIRGRRAIAVKKLPGDENCNPFDAAIHHVVSHESSHYPDCHPNVTQLTIALLNAGVDNLTQVPLYYQINGGTIVADTLNGPITSADTVNFTFSTPLTLGGPGDYEITIWTSYPGDTTQTNDTARVTISLYAGTAVTLPYTQNFDALSTCSTAWGCETINCSLGSGWFNVPNTPSVNGDSIDWRTDANGTGSGGTGPGGDHTSGNGNYLYLEGSGNGGSGCQNKEALLHSPCFDLTGTQSPQLSYWYHAFGPSIGALHVDALVEGRWELDIAPEVSGNQGNQWSQGFADLSPFQGKEVVIRFRGSTGNGYQSDLAIDDINLDTRPLTAFTASPTLICAGDTVQFTNTSTYANTYDWQISPTGFSFVNGTNAQSQDPTVLFSNTGQYTVTLITTNNFGSDTLTQTAYIDAGPHSISLLASDPDLTICTGTSVTFTGDTGFVGYDFQVGGTSVQNGTSNVFTSNSLQDGETVSVTGILGSGCQTAPASLTFIVDDTLNSSIVVDTTNCPSIQFSELALGGMTQQWEWDFGNLMGNSTLAAPQYDYSATGNGIYIVTLMLENECGLDTVTENVEIFCISINHREELAGNMKLYPNPGNGLYTLEIPDESGEMELSVTGLTGQVVWESTVFLQQAPVQLDVRSLPAGVYMLHLNLNDREYIRKLVKH